MLTFCPAFNCSNRAGKEKGKSNYRFPSIAKNNGKEGLKLSKVRKEEKVVSSNFQERFKWDKTSLVKNYTILKSSNIKKNGIQSPRNSDYDLIRELRSHIQTL